MQDKLNIAVFVDYDNIEIGVKSTLRREFDVSLALDALKERGDIVAKFAYANWGRQEGATRQMAENAVQMVQRIPSPRGDKNGADINLALDALEMAFTHNHVNAFAIVSGDSDFIPLVNKLKEYGKTVFVVGGKAFTSTILQQNCHEFVSYESLLDSPSARGRSVAVVPHVQAPLQGPSAQQPPPHQGPSQQHQPPPRDSHKGDRGDKPPQQQQQRHRPAPLDLNLAMPLVERALQVLERRGVQPQLGLLKSTMLQLDSTFSERAYGAGSFSDFVERMKKADLVNVTGGGGRYLIERKTTTPEKIQPKPEELLPLLRDVLEIHRMEMENGVLSETLEGWVKEEREDFNSTSYGFQEFTEFLNYAQDKLVVRIEPDEEKGLQVYMGAEFYPPAPPPTREPEAAGEEDEVQPIVPGQPSLVDPNPPPLPEPPPAKRPRAKTVRKRTPPQGNVAEKPRRSSTPRKKKAPTQ